MTNELFQNRVCDLVEKVIGQVSYKSRESTVHEVCEYIPKIYSTYDKDSARVFFNYFGITKFIFGEYGELGKVQLLNDNLDTVLSLAFEDSDKMHCFFITDKKEKNEYY